MNTRKAYYLAMALGISQLAALPVLAQDAPARDASTAETRIAASLDAAVEAGIPVQLIESKLQEGRAKQIPAERIAAAVEARLDALVRARDAMARANVENVSAGDLSVGADALEAGVSETALIAIQTSAPQERRAVAIAVLAALVELGNVPDVALERVQAALGNGPAGLADLRARTLAELRARGGGPPVDLDAAARIDAALSLGNRRGGG